MIDEKLVRHIAYLARIGIEDAEVRKFAEELRGILSYVEELKKVNVTGVEPIAQITGATDATRADAPVQDGGVVPPNLQEDFLEEQAPGFLDGTVRVPRILQ